MRPFISAAPAKAFTCLRASAAQTLNVSPHTATQLLTDIFPENIAKSVAEGQVLQIVVFRACSSRWDSFWFPK